MFNSLCINSQEGINSGNGTNKTGIDQSFIIDTMLFYGEVNLFLTKGDLAILLRIFGEDILLELLQRKRIHPIVRLHEFQNNWGYNDKGQYISRFDFNQLSLDNYLYNEHKEIVKNSSSNFKFADKFAEYISQVEYPETLQDEVLNDILSREYFQKTISLFLNGLKIPDDFILEIEQIKTDQSDGFILHNFINKIKFFWGNPKNYKDNIISLDLSKIIHPICEARKLGYLSALYNSELATDQPKLAQLVNWQISDVITNNFDSSSEIQSFNKYVLSGYPSLGEALSNGIINSKKFLSLMDESEKFRGWISNIPQNEGALVSEYIKELSKKTLADNNISKVIRYVVTQIFSFIPVVGVVGNLISAADTFYVEKLLKGWKPNQFINDKLITAIGPHRTL